jgi:hypothetical protein
MMITAAILTLLAHWLWVALVVFGALWTRGRPLWSTLHVLSLLSAIAVQFAMWPCPLTVAEQYFESRAGLPVYQGRFLVHYIDATVNPNISAGLVGAVATAFCCFNLGIYLWRFRKHLLLNRTPAGNDDF